MAPWVLALTGGVGGAKLCLGLAEELPGDQLHALVNTGDDFSHLGLHISPDIDTLLYTLAGRSNQNLGWGLETESWQVMDALAALDGETWFRLGDKDLATHLWRTQALAQGRSFTDVVTSLAKKMGIATGVHPMSEDAVRTKVSTSEGELAFQDYFVRLQCEPVVTGFRFEGVGQARPNPKVLELFAVRRPSAIIICPSNPFVSIDPILQIPGMARLIAQSGAPVIAVCPIVAGMAIKGPAAKMMAELKMPVDAVAVAKHYHERYPGLLSGFVIDHGDAILGVDIDALGLEVGITNTIMKSRADKQRLAKFVLDMAARGKKETQNGSQQ